MSIQHHDCISYLSTQPRATSTNTSRGAPFTNTTRGEPFDVRSRRKSKVDQHFPSIRRKRSTLFYDSDDSLPSSQSPLPSPRSVAFKKRRISTNPERDIQSHPNHNQPITMPEIQNRIEPQLQSQTTQLTQQTLLSQTQFTPKDSVLSSQLSMQHSSDMAPYSGPYITPSPKHSNNSNPKPVNPLSPYSKSRVNSISDMNSMKSPISSHQRTTTTTTRRHSSVTFKSTVDDVVDVGIPGIPPIDVIYGPSPHHNYSQNESHLHLAPEAQCGTSVHSPRVIPSVSGQKRKRLHEYRSDFDDVDQYNKHNAVNAVRSQTKFQSQVSSESQLYPPYGPYPGNPQIGNPKIGNHQIGNPQNHDPFRYQPPSPDTAQRQQLLPPSSTYSQFKEFKAGDAIYIMFQEYYRKYLETRPLIELIHEVSSTNNDVDRLETLCQNTGYIDAQIIAFYRLSNTLTDAMSARARSMDIHMDIDWKVVRNWNIIVIQHGDDQFIVHDVCDHFGRSRMSEYVLTESEFLYSIQGPHRGDFVKIKSESQTDGVHKGYGRILEISPIDGEHYRLSPFKCLSVVSLTSDQKMDIFADGQKSFRCNPWDIEVIGRQTNDDERGGHADMAFDDEHNEILGKQKMVQFLKSELVQLLPVQSTPFSPEFKRIEDLLEDERTLFDLQMSLDTLEGILYGIVREMSYKYLCLMGEDKRKYDGQFVAIIERIIGLSRPEMQRLMARVQSVDLLMSGNW